MTLYRRHFLAAALALPAIGARAADGKVLRVGFQKGEPAQMAAKQNHDLEKLLAPLGWDIQWIEFQFGPPLLEAMRVGSIDLGAVGDTPPVFAQAAHADLLYVAALRSGSQAILLPPGSPIQTLADLKGKNWRSAEAHRRTTSLSRPWTRPASTTPASRSSRSVQPMPVPPSSVGQSMRGPFGTRITRCSKRGLACAH